MRHCGRLSIAVIGALCVASTSSSAQLRGSYQPGSAGLMSGTQGPPGISLFAPIYYYTTNNLKNGDGNTVGPRPQVSSPSLGLGVSWVFDETVLGANFGGSVVPLIFKKNAVEGPSLDADGQLEFGDMYVQPFQFGWHLTSVDWLLGYGIFVPTGKYTFAATDNSGYGMWSQDLQGGLTLRLGDSDQWNGSLLTTLEWHGEKEDTDVRAGNILTLEGGIGRLMRRPVDNSPLPLAANIGLVYSAQWKVSDDHAESVILNSLLDGNHDRVFGLGGEFTMFVPQTLMQVGLRVMGDLGARNRTQGMTAMLSISWLAKPFGSLF